MPGRALRSGRRGRWFKSSRPDHECKDYSPSQEGFFCGLVICFHKGMVTARWDRTEAVLCQALEPALWKRDRSVDQNESIAVCFTRTVLQYFDGKAVWAYLPEDIDPARFMDGRVS